MSSTGKTPKITKHQNFEIATIHRNEIQKAPYNPRTLSEYNKRLLKKSLKANGLVEPLIWNRRTGTLVGGHQRLQTLDDLERNEDYLLTVSVVDVDEKQEKVLNIALNNTNIMGDWNEEALADLLKDMGQVEFDAIGVTDADLDVLLSEFQSPLALIDHDTEERAEIKGTLDAIKQDRSAMNERMKTENAADFFCTVIFRDDEERNLFYESFGLNIGDMHFRAEDLLKHL